MRKYISYIILLLVSLFSVFSINSCNEIGKIDKEEINITYKVTGYYVDPAARKHSCKRYVFLHNDKYGDFTFEVSPKTYYDASQGQKYMTFTSDLRELMYKADNKSTKENLIANIKDFNVDNAWCIEYDNWIFIWLFIGYSVFMLILLFYLVDQENINFIYLISLIILILSLIISTIITFV